MKYRILIYILFIIIVVFLFSSYKYKYYNSSFNSNIYEKVKYQSYLTKRFYYTEKENAFYDKVRIRVN